MVLVVENGSQIRLFVKVIVELESELEAVKLDLENAKWDVTHYGKRVDEINQALQKLESAV